MGITSLVGPSHTLVFFTKKSKIMGSAFFFGGFAMICIGWYMFTMIGFILQMYGIFLLFRSFIKTIFAYMQTLPVIGPVLRDTPFIHKIVNALSNSGQSSQGGHAKKFEVWILI